MKKCVGVAGCEENNDSCKNKSKDDACDCPTGLKSPFNKCTSVGGVGECKEIKTECGQDDNCTPGTACEAPCTFPNTKPYWRCDGNQKCEKVNECGIAIAPLCKEGKDGAPCFPCPQICIRGQQAGCSTFGADPCTNWPFDCPNGGNAVSPGCCCTVTPIIIDINGDGYSLTKPISGVNFDFDNDGVKEKISWTSIFSDDAFLVLDRNNNGVIDGGSELFGSSTPQPYSEKLNGFIALAEFDKTANGGNKDGKIDYQDAIFSQLRLWRDFNHDGISQVGGSRENELFTLSELGVLSIGLSYVEDMTVDINGNWFRYRGTAYHVGGQSSVGVPRFLWDVLLQKATN
ncbi:MAG: hypothetical protein HYR56_08675 [Acidobacteria bacterium]|nr:hypothetical protein [Acidobacteriota bacterium]MBI3426082.1 hypothetical protein [Acidobacteriota bacterium]